MCPTKLPSARVRQILAGAAQIRVLVVGDVMLDHFIWGSVARISPEAPVPVVEFERESFMPGGAANVARNLAALNAATELYGVVGRDGAADQLKSLLADHQIGCRGLLGAAARSTSGPSDKAQPSLSVIMAKVLLPNHCWTNSRVRAGSREFG